MPKSVVQFPEKLAPIFAKFGSIGTIFQVKLAKEKAMLSETDKAYLAGIMDGEGCITVWKSKCYDNRVLTVAVVMNDREAVDMLYAEFGGCLFHLKKQNVKWRDGWRWAVKSRRAKIALEAILPYLRVKGPQARAALELIGSFTHIGGRATAEQRETQRILHERISALNQRVA